MMLLVFRIFVFIWQSPIAPVPGHSYLQTSQSLKNFWMPLKQAHTYILYETTHATSQGLCWVKTGEELHQTDLTEVDVNEWLFHGLAYFISWLNKNLKTKSSRQR